MSASGPSGPLVILTFSQPLFLVLKMLSAFYVCCIFSNALQTHFFLEANNIYHDHLGPYYLQYRLPKNISI